MAVLPPLNQEWTIIVSSNSSKKPDTVSTSAHVLVIILSLKKRHPRLRCFKEYIKLDRDKSTFKSHRDFSSEIEITFKHF